MAMPEEKTLTAFSQLLKTLRYNSKRYTNKPSALQVEVLLHVAVKPRTYEELANLTNTTNGPISRAVASMTPRIENEKLVRPDTHLLDRRIKPSSRTYLVSLSPTGKELMKQVGLFSSNEK